MVFLMPLHIGPYTLHIRTECYGNRTHVVLRSPGWLSRQLQRLPWLPIMRPEHLLFRHEAKSLGTLTFPLPFRMLTIDIYRQRRAEATSD
jgi:hypothetical protein